MTGHADRAQAVAQEFSDLVRDVETTNPGGALLIVQAMETATREWQTARQSRTELLHGHLARLAELLDGEPNPRERMDLWKTAMSFTVQRTRADFEKTTGRTVEEP